MSAKQFVSLCPIEDLLVLIGGRWKPVILWWLRDIKVPLRFTILRTKMPRISQKVLTKQLRELERDGLIKKQMFAEMPVRDGGTRHHSLGNQLSIRFLVSQLRYNAPAGISAPRAPVKQNEHSVMVFVLGDDAVPVE